MRYKILTIPPFDSQLKRLIKKYPSLKSEIEKLGNELSENPVQGVSLGKSCYKIRLAIASKRKGKSGGARVITHIHVTESNLYMLSIYDKSEKADLEKEELDVMLNKIEM